MSDSKIRSVDDLLIKTENERLKIPTSDPVKEIKETKAEEVKTESLTPKVEEVAKEAAEPEVAEEKASEEEVEAEEPAKEGNVDAYGNEIPEAKMYSEEEVQRMIRERLSRGRNAEQQEQIRDVAKDFKADPNSEETWETQLEQFVEKTITKVADKQKNRAWEEEQKVNQAAFEDKFARGINKYKDFETTVRGKPITTSMMMATRSMEDPAAFIYAACKQQPKELERISKMTDPYAQIAEVGRLEERMKKARLVTASPKPSKKITGDGSDKMPERSIDQLIASHAKSKIMNNRK